MDRHLYFSLFLTIMTTALGVSQVVPLLPVYAQELGATGFHLGLIFSSFALARSIFLPLVGKYSDTYGRRAFMLWGLFFYTLIAIGFVLSSQVYQLILCRFFLGGAAAMVIPVARAYVGDMTAPGHEGRIMGHFNMAFFGGLAIGPWMGGFLKDFFGIASAFYSMGLLSALGFFLALATLPKSRSAQARHEQTQISYAALMRIPILAAVFLFRFGSIIGVGVLWTFLPLYAHERLALTSGRIGILVSLTVIMTTLLQPVFGRLADRVSRTRMALAGGLMASLTLMLLPFCRSFAHLFVLNLAIGSAIGLYMPPLMAMAVDVGRETGFITRVMSVLEMAFSLGMVFGPILAGLLKEALGLDAVFWVGGAIGISSCFVFVGMLHRRQVSEIT